MNIFKSFFYKKQGNLNKQKEDYYPLSFQQESIWLSMQLRDDNDLWNISDIRYFSEKVEEGLLKKAFEKLIENNAILRTNIILIDNEPFQFISKSNKNFYKSYDFSRSENVNKIEELINQDKQKPFDIEKDGLIRLFLFKKDEVNSLIYINIHHIISDNISLNLIWKELFNIYFLLQSNQKSEPKKLDYQYHDYSYWQRNTKISIQHEEYWLNEFSGTLPKTELRPDFIKKESSKTFGSVIYDLDEDSTAYLRKFSFINKTSTSSTLLAFFGVLLNQYINEEDLITGISFTGRKYKQRNLIGCFSRLCALRLNIDKNQSLNEFISYVHNKMDGAYKNQDYPLQDLVKAINPLRSGGNSPLFNIVFNYISSKSLGTNSDKVDVTEYINEGNSRYDLCFNIFELSKHIKIDIAYSSELYSKETISRLVIHFKELLKFIENPSVSLKNLSVLSEEDKHKLLYELNATSIDYPKEKCVHQLFEGQVEKTPDNIALVFDKEKLSYSELNKRSNKLGHFLRKKGVKAETLVGLHVERSVDMIVCLLGILKAGGAYLPIDPSYPQERISYMFEDSECPILLTQKSVHDTLPEVDNTLTICIDDENYAEEVATEQELNVRSNVQPHNLIYIIYTSGSTGRPKGTEIVHTNVNRLVSNREFAFLNSQNKVLQYAPISFDASTFEIWGTLCSGSELIICPKGKLSIEELGRTIIDANISVLWLTAGLFSLVVENDISILANIKYLLAGGDVLNPNHVRKILNTFKDVVLINGYGPTESTTFTTLYFMNSNTVINKTVPIGKPIDNTQVFVLDKNQKLLPFGASGELCISGDGLARGYLKRPELTKDKFVKNPFSNALDSCLYRTGDLVRYLPDGNIEFIGRIDNQVKIRGFRVELGEIESRLLTHKEIKGTVVEVKEKDDDKFLVGYYVSENKIVVEEIREHVLKSLPEYMIPSYFVHMEKLPLTANGKIDRKSLPEPEVKAGSDYVGPSVEMEEKLVEMWSEILKIDKAVISVNRSFFELGGNSLKIIKLSMLISNNLGIDLPVKEIMQLDTVKNISTFLYTIMWHKNANKQESSIIENEIEI